MAKNREEHEHAAQQLATLEKEIAVEELRLQLEKSHAKDTSGERA